VYEECHLSNTYGSAEITETATCYEICRDDLNEMISIPIGRLLDGYHVYVVDEYGEEVIPNEQGEIVIRDVGVFGEYYGREDLNEAVLIEMNGENCYKTGDYGGIDVKSGELMFVGRKDFQIKLRGQRIELSMIESAILHSSSEVLNCIVIKEDASNHSYLCAYLKIRESMDKKKIKEEVMTKCHDHLRSYMIPLKWFFVSDFLLNSNGKIDRQKLSNVVEFVDTESICEQNKTLSPLERKLENIFICAFTLKTSLDILKSFGELGGTSLVAMHALILIRQEIYENKWK
jgi:acyl-coenzyme A synthetase/AMP-(fatty) acid ligase